MPGPTLYRTVADAIAALPERLPCVAAFDPAGPGQERRGGPTPTRPGPHFGEMVG
jgi:hypothetical protein